MKLFLIKVIGQENQLFNYSEPVLTFTAAVSVSELIEAHRSERKDLEKTFAKEYRPIGTIFKSLEPTT